jgi:hypothetical protein
MKKYYSIILFVTIYILLVHLSFAQSTCDKYGTISVANGEYTLTNNEWGSDARQCIQATGGTGFKVTSCEINQNSVGSFPSIYKGCHWGNCTSNSGCPIQVNQIGSGSVSFSVSSSRPSGKYDIMTEGWFSPSTNSSNGYNGGAELLVALDYIGMTWAGNQVGTFNGYNVYYSNVGWNFVQYVKTGQSSLNINIKDFINDMISRGYIQSNWYLHDWEAGFEIESGGVGLTANSFSFSVSRGGGSSTTTSVGPTNPPTSSTTTSSGGGSTTTSSGGGNASGCTCAAGCSSQTSISSNFTKDGAGTFCFVASSLNSYVNSWNMDSLTINGTDYTNKYASISSLPKNSDGKYYIYYKASYTWSHFEAK